MSLSNQRSSLNLYGLFRSLSSFPDVLSPSKRWRILRTYVLYRRFLWRKLVARERLEVSVCGGLNKEISNWTSKAGVDKIILTDECHKLISRRLWHLPPHASLLVKRMRILQWIRFLRTREKKTWKLLHVGLAIKGLWWALLILNWVQKITSHFLSYFLPLRLSRRWWNEDFYKPPYKISQSGVPLIYGQKGYLQAVVAF